MAQKLDETPANSAKLVMLAESGINWTWYLEARLNEAEKTAHILLHHRFHHGDRQPKTTSHDSFDLIENSDRTVTGLKVRAFNNSIGGPREETTYTVTNPAYIFSYKDFSTCPVCGENCGYYNLPLGCGK